MKISPKLKFECQEDWNNMKIGMLSRHCENCKKDVIDFTKMSKEEILILLLKNRDKEICGHIQKSKLDFHQEEIAVIINRQMRYYKKTNFAFYLLVVSTLSLLGCSENDENFTNTRIEQLPFKIHSEKQVSEEKVTVEKEKTPARSGIDTVKTKKLVNDSIVNYYESKLSIDSNLTPDFPPLMGIISYEGGAQEHSPINTDEVLILAEKMPKFKGGIDSLQAYLKREINYPGYEADNNIEGTVYVSFVVTKTGEITKSTIVRSVKDSQHFNDEVLRVVNKMPNWIPGENHEEKVDVVMHIPIVFKL